jgi:hypothetical protein
MSQIESGPRPERGGGAEPLIALSVLAGATERIRLQTEVLLGPPTITPPPEPRCDTGARNSTNN